MSGPIVTTQSTNDSAVGLAFPAAVGLVSEFDFGAGDFELPKFGGVGTWGIQGTTIAEGATWSTKEAIRAQGRASTTSTVGFIPGHSGIDGPEVAYLQWQAVVAAGGQ